MEKIIYYYWITVQYRVQDTKVHLTATTVTTTRPQLKLKINSNSFEKFILILSKLHLCIICRAVSISLWQQRLILQRKNFGMFVGLYHQYPERSSSTKCNRFYVLTNLIEGKFGRFHAALHLHSSVCIRKFLILHHWSKHTHFCLARILRACVFVHALCRTLSFFHYSISWN